jgi:hypothetical protein
MCDRNLLWRSIRSAWRTAYRRSCFQIEWVFGGRPKLVARGAGAPHSRSAARTVADGEVFAWFGQVAYQPSQRDRAAAVEHLHAPTPDRATPLPSQVIWPRARPSTMQSRVLRHVLCRADVRRLLRLSKGERRRLWRRPHGTPLIGAPHKKKARIGSGQVWGGRV